MQIQFRLLGESRRERVRKIAREAFLEFQSIPSRCHDVAEKRIRQTFTGWEVLLVRIAIQLAFLLIEYWLRNRTYVPHPQFVAGEPGSGKRFL